VSPSWNPIAAEVASLADDRGLAAAAEPDPRERRLLEREAVLLARAADVARTRPMEGVMVHCACQGVVVDAGSLVMWGISPEGEAAVRALALDPAVDVHTVDACAVLRAVLGVPAEHVPPSVVV
jgi:hypothetical protein